MGSNSITTCLLPFTYNKKRIIIIFSLYFSILNINI